ncbi:MAG TPA: recombinase family protein [Solirubrobacteraceae bacterium]|nr:recombinase family protein [Solirubrobacteraceae bacterium]
MIADYAEESFSAFRGSRGPELVDAMEHAEDLVREYGTAEPWAQHSDRLARGDGRIARHVVEIGLWGLKRDVAVRTVQDPETFRDLLYAVVTGQRNHEDSRRKGAAMKAGRRRAAARGEFIGYRPDGYVLEIELRDGEIKKQMVLDPDRQEIIETIFRMALRRRPTGAIARRLNDQGWLTNPRRKDALPQRWRVHHVDAVLRNRRYAGLAVFGGEVVGRGHWPVYISEAQHAQLKRVRKAVRDRRTMRLVDIEY